MNGIGLMAGTALAVGIQLVVVGASAGSMLSVSVGVPLALVGLVGLLDDLVFHERITKKVLGIN